MFEGEHIPLATIPGMADRTVSIHSMSKSYSVTGWRIGWTIAPSDLTVGIRRVHDFLTVGAAAPLQAAAVVALQFPSTLLHRPGRRLPRAAATACSPRSAPRASASREPAGAYYVMTDIADLTERGRRRVRACG